MKINWSKINNFGRESTGETHGGDEFESHAIHDDAARAERHHWGVRQIWLTRLARGAIAAAVVAGVLALFLAATGSSKTAPAPPRDAAPEVVDTAAQAKAGELAEQLVVTWLQAARGQERDLTKFVDLAGGVLPGTSLFVAVDPAVASIAKVPDPNGSLNASHAAMYSVTVAVSVRAASDGAATPVRRYFQVPVAVTGTGVRAATLPAEVPAPSTAIEVSLGYRYQIMSNPIVESASQFLSAMLAGSGEVARYVTPGVTVAPISPPPFKSVSVSTALASKDLSAVDPAVALADGDVVRLLVTTSQKVSETDAVSGQYALTMTSRGGRWEVTAIDASPLLPQTAPRTQQGSTASPSSSAQPGAGRPTQSSTTPSAAATHSAVPAQTTVAPPAVGVPLFSSPPTGSGLSVPPER